MSDPKRQNMRARASGGFVVMPRIIKNKTAEVYYRNAIDKLTDQMITALVGALERAYTSVAVMNATPEPPKIKGHSVKDMEKLLNYYKVKHTPIFLKESEKIIRKWLERGDKSIRTSITRAMQDIQGKDFVIQFDRQKYDTILRLIVQRNVGLIQNTTLQTLNNIENIVYDGVTTGQPWTAVSKDLANQKHIAHDRIKRIARDQTGKLNETLNELAQRDAGVKFFRWRTVDDERVSTGFGGHKQLDGKIYKWGDVSHYPIVDSYGHRGVPHQRPNCLKGDTIVDLMQPVEKIYRRRYKGLGNIITLDGHRAIFATPNHPFLTKKGWVPANRLKCGDDVICVEPIAPSPYDIYGGNISLKQVFKALSLLRLTASTVSGSGHQFHGDGIINEKVNIIDIDGFLRDNRIATLNKCLSQFRLPETDMRLKTRYFTTLGRAYAYMVRADATSGLMSLVSELLQISRGHLTESKLISLRTITDMEAVLNKYRYDFVPGHVKLFRKCQDALAFRIKSAYGIFGQIIYTRGIGSDSDIALPKRQTNRLTGNMIAAAYRFNGIPVKIVYKKVIRNCIKRFSCHIYNLQCKQGYYTIEKGIVNHNCRCTAEAIILRKGYQARQTREGDWVIKPEDML